MVQDKKRNRAETNAARARTDEEPAAHDAQLTAEWGVSQQELEAAKERAAELGYEGNEEIVFLCAKGVANSTVDLSDVKTAKRFALVLSPPTPEWTNCRALRHCRLASERQPFGFRHQTAGSSRNQLRKLRRGQSGLGRGAQLGVLPRRPCVQESKC